MECLIGTIIPWANTFEPQDWMFCKGQTLTIQQYQALFGVIGNRFGGDGITNFKLPNLCGEVIVGTKGNYSMAQTGGSIGVTLTQNTMPPHNHNVQGNANSKTSGSNSPDQTKVLGVATTGGAKPVPIPMYDVYTNNQGDLVNFHPSSIGTAGAATVAEHENRQPYLALNYIICLVGDYPVRN